MIKKTRAQSSRSRSGCLTCRARHIKCDESGPICKNCIKSNKVCERGARLNFLKCMVVKPTHSAMKLNSIRISDYEFMDQSLSIHKVYKENKFHDYSSWLRNHTELELLESDIDIQEAQATSSTLPASQKKSNNQKSTPKKQNYNISESPSVPINSEDNSDSDINSIRSITSTPQSTINKLVSLAQSRNIDRSLFAYSEQEPTYPNPYRSFNDTNNTEPLTLSDFDKVIDYLDSHDSDNFNIETTELKMNFSLLLSSLVTSLKLKKLSGLFDESYLSSKIISYINEVLKIEQHQTYDNLMNFFELLLLDLNYSLIHKKPMKNKVNDENVDFLLRKIISWSLFDDLNYFLIKIMIILMKLNNLYYRPHAENHQFLLFNLINEIKSLEDNQFITAFLPRISHHSFSSSSSNSTNRNRSHSESSSSFSITPKVEFQNLKIRRLHVYYNFTLLFIYKKFTLKNDYKATFYKPTTLMNFWTSVENDLFQRLTYLAVDYNYDSDPFINFINKKL